LSSERHTHSVAKLIADNILTIGDGYRAKNVELASTGIPFARVANIDDGFDFAEADLFPIDGLYKVGEKISRLGDVVLTSKGTVGRFAFVSEGTPQFVYSPQLSYWRSLDFNTIDPRFLFYWIQGEEFQEQADGVKSQTDMADYVSLSDQRRMKITLPSVEEQQAIARVLGALDDKIDLNRRMNHTLEEMGRSLFKSWFVDFDPITAKMEGRVPFGINAETASLFPAEFEATEEGLIPKDWKVGIAGDMVTAVGGTTPSTNESEYWNGGTIAWATPKDLAGLSHPVLLDTDRKITSEGLKQISSGLLPVGTLLMSSRAPVGYLAISEIPVAINQGFMAMHCNKGFPNYYVIQWLRENMETIISHANGTTFLEISKSSFRLIPAILPPEPIVRRFSEIAGKLHARIVANVKESKNIATIRDTLLPQLLSGELRVKQAEKVIENM
jgi:type I restriction enzyme, S subunit